MLIRPAHVWTWACKDWKLFFADRVGAGLCFAVPVILASVFGSVFQQHSGGPALRPEVLIVNEDTSPLSAAVVADLCGDGRLRARVADGAAAEQSVTRQGVVAVLLPAGFGDRARRAWRTDSGLPEVRLWCRGEGQVEAYWVEGVVTAALMKHLLRQTLAENPAAAALLGKAAGRVEDCRPPFAVVRSAPPSAPAPGCDVYTHSFLGMTIQYLLFLGMDSGLLLLRERRRGVWGRLQASPATLASVLLGKVLSTSAVALLLIGSTLGFGRVCFGVTVGGSPAGFAVMALALAVFSASVGLVVAAVGGSEARARTISILVILALSMLGGLWLPSFLFPDWVLSVSRLLPTAWALDGLEGLAGRGDGLARAAAAAAGLTIFTVSFIAIALWRFRWSEPGLRGVGA